MTEQLGTHTGGLRNLRVRPSYGLGGRVFVEQKPVSVDDDANARSITHDDDAPVVGEGCVRLLPVERREPRGLRAREVEELRDAHAELRSIADAVADTGLRDRVRAVGESIAALGERSDSVAIALTERERDVLTQVALGCTNAEAADRLGCPARPPRFGTWRRVSSLRSSRQVPHRVRAAGRIREGVGAAPQDEPRGPEHRLEMSRWCGIIAERRVRTRCRTRG